MTDRESYLSTIEQMVSRKEEAIVRLDQMIQERQKKINLLKDGEDKAAESYSLFLKKIREDSDVVVAKENERVRIAQEAAGISLMEISLAKDNFEKQKRELEEMRLDVENKSLHMSNQTIYLGNAINLIVENVSEIKKEHALNKSCLLKNSKIESNIDALSKILKDKEGQFVKKVEAEELRLEEMKKELDKKFAELNKKEVELSELHEFIKRERKQVDLEQKRLYSLAKSMRNA